MSTTLKVKIRDRWYAVEIEDPTGDRVHVLVDGDPVDVVFGSQPAGESAAVPGASEEQAPASGTPSSRRVFHSPMPGVIISVMVEKGDQVVTGDEVCVLEAMKMQQTLRADWSGVVRKVHVQPGQQVLDGDPLVEL